MLAAPRSRAILRRLNNRYTTRLSESREAYNKKRAQRMGVNEGEEYDLNTALDENTDDTIVKVIAGSFIAVMLGLGVFAAVM